MHVVDRMLTGWHEPEASHLLMIEAVAGLGDPGGAPHVAGGHETARDATGGVGAEPGHLRSPASHGVFPTLLSMREPSSLPFKLINCST